MDAPVGVGAEQLRVGGDHLRLVPYSEFQPESVYSVYKLAQAALELALVYEPVAQGAAVVVALAEPAVVHDEHIHAELLCTFGEGDELFRIKIKICRLPAVYQQGTLCGFPFAADEIVVIEPVICAAHLAYARIRIDDNRLGSHKALAGLKTPGEVIGVYAHDYARGAREVALGAELEVAAVNEIEAVGLAAVLVGIFGDESRKRVLTVTRNSALARNSLKSVGERAALLGALLGVSAVESYEVVIHARQVDAQAHRALDIRRLLRRVLDFCAAYDYIERVEYGIYERDANIGRSVRHIDFERVRLAVAVEVNRRQGLGGRLARVYPVPLIAHIGDGVAVRIFY